MPNSTGHSLTDSFWNGVVESEDGYKSVSFGTSGHRGRASDGSFNKVHIRAITHAVAEWRQKQGYTGPVFVAMDTHALSKPALEVVVETLEELGVPVRVDVKNGYTPTPVISRAILVHNRTYPDALSDGIILTPSHNPPEDGGIKYNGADGGPAGSVATGWIQQRANELMATLSYREESSINASREPAGKVDYVDDYVSKLPLVVDMDAIARSGVRIGVDPLGGSALDVWDAINEQFGLDLAVVNRSQSPDFAFMPPDHDGKIRMDCSSSAAMANVLARKDEFDLMFGNDPDADRHGIVDAGGLLNPNHYLVVCIDYLLRHRPQWGRDLGVGKTLVSSSLIDRVGASHGRTLFEVPVGFKWFVEGLHQGRLCFGGEESAGASFLTMDGQPWSTDKDGIILCLLAAEIYAVTGLTPHAYFQKLEAQHGATWYRRVDRPADQRIIERLKGLRAGALSGKLFGGDPIVKAEASAPGNGAPIGGIKVTTRNGWIAMRPSGTEPLYKIYGESFVGPEHLEQLLKDAAALVG
ncbi:phosphoglucomutase [Marinobacter segnicrescens]|uniref:Phosphoglucomutase n=1 Tax=Marinobacter segnicrescens TaxID=430453 RepID=A0A1I0HWK5_9GAMM|nr:alpha-D-glucose phosphate-specific phosphoglucomutase [Marinobacter segnicrescens]SET88450.1 phosphoglucomutase [Marinobacter segnicrescens]